MTATVGYRRDGGADGRAGGPAAHHAVDGLPHRRAAVIAASERPTLCRKGLHDLSDPANVGVQRSTGRQFCRACKREYRKAKRRERRTTLCKRGLHDLSDEANAYVRPGTGRKECRACKALAEKQRREAKAAEVAAEAARAPEAEAEKSARAAAWLVPPAGVRAPGRGVREEAAARYRLARMIRGGP